MKGVFVEELQNSLEDYNRKKLNLNETKKNFTESYLQDCEWNRKQLDNSEKQRQQYYDKIRMVQQERAGKFVDN